MIRFERYPAHGRAGRGRRPAGAIERAIEALGMPRAGFSGRSSAATFMARFESRPAVVPRSTTTLSGRRGNDG